LWLLRMATFGFLELAPLAAVCIWGLIEVRRSRRAFLAVALPICWCVPVLLAGVFTDWTSEIAKTADWVGTVALAGLIIQIIQSVAAIVMMKGQRALATVAVLVNLAIGLFAYFVVGMDASGAWL
jgi:hypothetical protein